MHLDVAARAVHALLAEAQHLEPRALARAPVHVDRVELHDRGEHGLLARADQVALGLLQLADAAGDRRADLGVAEVDLGLLEGGLGGVDLGRRLVAGGARVVEVGLAGDVLLLERGGALVVRGGALGLGAHALELALRLRDLGLVRRLLDHEQEVALAHVGAFLEEHLLEHAGHARAHLDRADGLGRADVLHEHRDLVLAHLGDADRERRLLRRTRAAAARRPDEQQERGDGAVANHPRDSSGATGDPSRSPRRLRSTSPIRPRAWAPAPSRCGRAAR